jgi:WD40 repeat protein
VALDAAGDWCVMDHTGAGKKVEPTLASVVRPGSARQKSGWSVPLAERGLGLITAEYLASLPGKKHFLVAEHFVSGREGTNRRITIRERADASVWMAAYGLFERGDIVCASPFGHIMVVLSKATLRAYDSRGLSESIRPIRNDEKKHFTAVAFHPSGRFLLVASTDETVKLYDVRTWEVVRSFAWDIGRMRSVAFSPDGTLAAAGSDKGKVVVWDVDI